MIFHWGDVIRKWRLEQRMSSKDLASRAGVDKNTIGRVERDRSTRVDTLEQIVQALGHTMTDLNEALGTSEIGPADRRLLTDWHRLEDDDRVFLSRTIRRLANLGGVVPPDIPTPAAAAPGSARRVDSERRGRSRRRGNGDQSRPGQ